MSSTQLPRFIARQLIFDELGPQDYFCTYCMTCTTDLKIHAVVCTQVGDHDLIRMMDFWNRYIKIREDFHRAIQNRRTHPGICVYLQQLHDNDVLKQFCIITGTCLQYDTTDREYYRYDISYQTNICRRHGILLH